MHITVMVILELAGVGEGSSLALPRLCLHVASGGSQEEHATGARLPQ